MPPVPIYIPISVIALSSQLVSSAGSCFASPNENQYYQQTSDYIDFFFYYRSTCAVFETFKPPILLVNNSARSSLKMHRDGKNPSLPSTVIEKQLPSAVRSVPVDLLRRRPLRTTPSTWCGLHLAAETKFEIAKAKDNHNSTTL